VDHPSGWIPGAIEHVGHVANPWLEPGATYDQELLLNKWFNLSEEGSYSLSLTFDGSISFPDGGKLALESIARGTSVTFQVLPRNEMALRKACESLSQVATQGGGDKRALAAAEALAYIRDPIAIPFLVDLAGRDGFADIAVRGFERIGTPESRQALEKLAIESSGDVASLAKGALARWKKFSAASERGFGPVFAKIDPLLSKANGSTELEIIPFTA
jgi:hypothetical protein